MDCPVVEVNHWSHDALQCSVPFLWVRWTTHDALQCSVPFLWVRWTTCLMIPSMLCTLPVGEVNHWSHDAHQCSVPFLWVRWTTGHMMSFNALYPSCGWSEPLVTWCPSMLCTLPVGEVNHWSHDALQCSVPFLWVRWTTCHMMSFNALYPSCGWGEPLVTWCPSMLYTLPSHFQSKLMFWQNGVYCLQDAGPLSYSHASSLTPPPPPATTTTKQMIMVIFSVRSNPSPPNFFFLSSLTVHSEGDLKKEFGKHLKSRNQNRKKAVM